MRAKTEFCMSVKTNLTAYYIAGPAFDLLVNPRHIDTQNTNCDENDTTEKQNR